MFWSRTVLASMVYLYLLKIWTSFQSVQGLLETRLRASTLSAPLINLDLEITEIKFSYW